MDYSTLATMIVASVLAPTFKSVGSSALMEVGKKFGGEAFEQRDIIFEKVKSLFVGEELTTLGLLAQSPEDPKVQGRVEGQLHEKLKANPNVAGELAELVRNFQSYQAGDKNALMYNSPNSKITIS